MKIFFVGLLILIKTSTRLRRRIKNDFCLGCNGHRNLKGHDLSKPNLFRFADKNKIPFDNTTEHNQNVLKEIKSDEENVEQICDKESSNEESSGDFDYVYENFDEIMKFLEKTSYNEPPKETLDMCKPVKIPYKKLRKVLMLRKHTKPRQKGNKIESIKKTYPVQAPCYVMQNRNKMTEKKVNNEKDLYEFQDSLSESSEEKSLN
ncbi:hypothetical protein NBO_607g0001 [Nosema bombycis CQ1]|uniref:Uncharacterized protein n=1 Tax=Nosema bombycis (strain CQ1 / CVCC 102059) TaxID=578461 RepID=R0M1T1_NOSB1|nr:hypothetical protein NBO_607g0001 [Nosema bombycis CQ1]|eukprot:EOB11979.1 hypothetical protein NBO_607g0001 [Nosema bombycis CQ1]